MSAETATASRGGALANLKQHGATILVAALSSLFAVSLILVTGVLGAAMSATVLSDSATFKLMLLMVSFVFIVIALYVGAIVTANTFSTIIAGRTRTIALYRLIGSTSKRIRSQVAGEGLLMGAIGAAIGFVLAELLIALFITVGPGLGWLPEGPTYPLFDPLTIVAVVVVAATTWAAAWAGSRRVGLVSPIAATGAAVEMRADDARGRTARTVWAWIMIAIGAAVIALGLWISASNPIALVISFFGGLFSFTGIAIGAHVIMPPVLKLTGKLIDRGPTGKLAAANAVRFPERSARATIGLVIGVTLVIMFAVALESFRSGILSQMDGSPEETAAINDALNVVTSVFTGLVGFSAVIAAVGMVNTLSLSVMQRTRELGLLRALGFTGAQVRKMVLTESAQMTIAALGLGTVLGVFYGWVAAQSLLGAQFGVIGLSIPWLMVLGVAVFGTALALVAAAGPARRAIRVSPVTALAVS